MERTALCFVVGSGWIRNCEKHGISLPSPPYCPAMCEPSCEEADHQSLETGGDRGKLPQTPDDRELVLYEVFQYLIKNRIRRFMELIASPSSVRFGFHMEMYVSTHLVVQFGCMVNSQVRKTRTEPRRSSSQQLPSSELFCFRSEASLKDLLSSLETNANGHATIRLDHIPSRGIALGICQIKRTYTKVTPTSSSG